MQFHVASLYPLLYRLEKRIAVLELAPGREAEIVEELAQHADDLKSCWLTEWQKLKLLELCLPN